MEAASNGDKRDGSPLKDRARAPSGAPDAGIVSASPRPEKEKAVARTTALSDPVSACAAGVTSNAKQGDLQVLPFRCKIGGFVMGAHDPLKAPASCKMRIVTVFLVALLTWHYPTAADDPSEIAEEEGEKARMLKDLNDVAQDQDHWHNMDEDVRRYMAGAFLEIYLRVSKKRETPFDWYLKMVENHFRNRTLYNISLDSAKESFFGEKFIERSTKSFLAFPGEEAARELMNEWSEIHEKILNIMRQSLTRKVNRAILTSQVRAEMLAALSREHGNDKWLQVLDEEMVVQHLLEWVEKKDRTEELETDYLDPFYWLGAKKAYVDTRTANTRIQEIHRLMEAIDRKDVYIKSLNGFYQCFIALLRTVSLKAGEKYISDAETAIRNLTISNAHRGQTLDALIGHSDLAIFCNADVGSGETVKDRRPAFEMYDWGWRDILRNRNPDMPFVFMPVRPVYVLKGKFLDDTINILVIDPGNDSKKIFATESGPDHLDNEDAEAKADESLPEFTDETFFLLFLKRIRGDVYVPVTGLGTVEMSAFAVEPFNKKDLVGSVKRLDEKVK